ncbi:MAG: serine hydrolase, partial [Halieaceae bacterium]|nr:serine hydrolase [Halieaceae bacterium]
MKIPARWFTALVLCVTAVAPTQADDHKVPTAADADTTNVLFLPQDVRKQVFGNIRGVFPSRTVSVGDSVKTLNAAYRDFDNLTYQVQGQTYKLADFFKRKAHRGLIVVK